MTWKTTLLTGVAIIIAWIIFGNPFSAPTIRTTRTEAPALSYAPALSCPRGYTSGGDGWCYAPPSLQPPPPQNYSCPGNGYTSGADGWCYKTF